MTAKRMKTYYVFAHDDPDWITLKFPYNPDVIVRIKTLDWSLREWDADAKRWGMENDLFEENCDFLFPPHLWECVNRTDDEPRASAPPPKQPPPHTPPPPPPPPFFSNAHDVLWVKPGAPSEVVKAAYSALIRKYHPDAGGDEEMAKKINAAYARLK